MEERSEKPSVQRLREARKKGDIAKSVDLAFALTLLAAVLLLWFMAPVFKLRLEVICTELSLLLQTPDLKECSRVLKPLLFPLLGMFGVIFMVALFSHVIQVGWVWNFPSQRVKKSNRGLFLTIKLVVLALVALAHLLHNRSLVNEVGECGEIGWLLNNLFYLMLKLCIALLILGLCDLFYQRWSRYKRLHMTPSELKEEKKESEGNRNLRR